MAGELAGELWEVTAENQVSVLGLWIAGEFGVLSGSWELGVERPA
jgi:hypothetical protein